MAQTEPETKPGKHGNNGLFLSFLTAAHNVANMVMSDDEVERLSTGPSLPLAKQPNRLLPKPVHKSQGLSNNTSRTSVHSHNDHSNLSGPNSHDNDAGSAMVQFPALPRLSTSNVHFEPVHDSPINTMGNGDLQLLHFDGKTSTENDIVPLVSINGTKHANSSLELLSVLGGADSKVVKRRRRGSELSLTESNSEELSIAETEGSNQELDRLLESSEVTFASSKKNKEFHHVFKRIPLSERLIADYSCALSKDILVQGKMYLTQNYICFNSNILGWVTHLVIPLQEVIQIEKRSTAVLFPNGMVVRTLHQRYIFATFISRDATFAQITRVWHDVLLGKSEAKPNGRARSQSRVSNRTGESEVSVGSEDDATGDEEDDQGSLSSDTSYDQEDTSMRDRSSSRTKIEDEKEGDNDGDENAKAEDDDEGSLPKVSEDEGVGGGDFKGLKNPGPAKHEPTKADREDESNDVFVMDHTFKAPPGVIYSILFGPDTSNYIRVLEDQKNFDIEKDKITDLSMKNKERKYSYTKPLSGPIGPKQNKCNITDRLVHCDFSRYIHVEQITQTPDVPLGNSFKIVTTILFSWAEDNNTNMHVVTSIEWSGKSWIKGAIEKGSIDGQKDSMKSLVETVTDIIEHGLGGSKKKRKRSKSTRRPPQAEEQAKPEAPKELTLFEHIAKIAETIGKSIPVSIPKISDATLGGLILLLGAFVYTWVLAHLFGSSAKVPVLNDADGSARLLRFGNNNFYVMPSQERYINDKQGRMVKEARMWSWINLRSQGKIPNVSKSQESAQYMDLYASQEFEEIVKLTKQRVDELYRRINN